MSLLMDALRKAEAEKKAAVARDAGDPASDALASASDELRLEPLQDVTLERLANSRSGEFADVNVANTTQRLSASGRYRYRAGDATLADELPFDRAPRPAAAGNGALHRPELVTAHNVIRAGARSGVNPAFVAAFVVALGFILGLGGYAYYYYRHLPLAPALPSPRVLDAIETPATPLAPAPSIGLEPVVVLPPPASEPVAAPIADASVHAEMQALATAQSQVESATAPAPALIPAPPPTLNKDTEVTSGEVRIARGAGTSAATSSANLELTRAYAAFVAGDYAAAERAYRKVLARAPRALDAWLGLANIALANGDLRTAHRYFARVLLEEPTHSAAVAGIALIEGDGAGPATETKLKLALDKGANAPYLHFALGNLYARRAHWPDAQQAYFEAFRSDPHNPDYAFNLAVSLEHLGQRQAALEYYRQAQILATNTKAAFDTNIATQRIAALSVAQ
ncbi:MAG: tetratricopeptide repeat protein [Gammaproteobacteria bacterium]